MSLTQIWAKKTVFVQALNRPHRPVGGRIGGVAERLWRFDMPKTVSGCIWGGFFLLFLLYFAGCSSDGESSQASSNWGAAEIIQTGTSEAMFPQVAVDENGGAVAVWHQDNGLGTNNIWANHYNADTKKWGTAQIIQASEDEALYPQVAVDPGGNAVAVWCQFYSPGIYNIWASRYDAGEGTWGTSQIIQTGTADAMYPQIAVDSSGNAIAVWYQDDGSVHYNTWANRYDADTGTWGTSVLIEGKSEGAVGPRVAIDTDGNAVSVWCQLSSPTEYSIFANRYDSALGTWEGAEIIQAGTTDALYPDVAIDTNGNAIAVWYQDDGTGSYRIFANRYDAATGMWENPMIIQVGSGDAAYPKVAVDTSGNAIAVWYQDDGTGSYRIWANRYDTALGTWGTAGVIQSGSGDAESPRVAVDTNGNAVAVWYQDDGTVNYNIWANRFDAASGTWGTAVLIQKGTGDAAYPSVAVNPDGNGVAVWYQDDGAGTDNVWGAIWTLSP